MPVVIDPAAVVALHPGLDLAQAQALIDSTLARAARVAPCLTAADFAYADAARAILLDVIGRRVEAGSGVVQSEAAGPLTRTFFPPGRSLFWPTEIDELQGLCAAGTAAAAATALPAWRMPEPELPDPFRRPWPAGPTPT